MNLLGSQQSRPWGYHVVRAIDNDDYDGMINAFKAPSADINAQVCGEYGGYKWTPHMIRYYGDTVCHLCVKFRRKMALYAALGLHPRLSVRNGYQKTVDDLLKETWNVGIKEVAEAAMEHRERRAMGFEEVYEKERLKEWSELRERAKINYWRSLMDLDSGVSATYALQCERYGIITPWRENFQGSILTELRKSLMVEKEMTRISENSLRTSHKDEEDMFEGVCERIRRSQYNELSSHKQLRFMKMTTDRLSRLCAAIQSSPCRFTITRFVLSSKRMNRAHIAVLLESKIDETPWIANLSYLDLSCNAIQDDGAEMIGMAFRNSILKSLGTLCLHGNRITAIGAKALLVDSVEAPQNALKRILLHQNPIVEDMKESLHVIAKNSFLDLVL